MKIENCRGDARKAQICRQFLLTPVLHLKLLPGQKVPGCCGSITDHYYHFEAVDRTGGQPTSFSVGYDCADQFLRLINRARLPLFNPLATDIESTGLDEDARADGRQVGGPGSRRSDPLNREISAAIHVLFIAWRGIKPGGSLTRILTEIRRTPDVPAPIQVVMHLNAIVGKDARHRTLTQIVADLRKDHPNFKTYDFPNEISSRVVDRV